MKQLNIFRAAGMLAMLFLLAFTQTAHAQATLSIQGIIRKSNGAAVDDGKYDLTFKLYPTTSGGTAVHTETQTVNVAGGIYSTELGGSTPLTAPFNQTYYLGVSVDGGAELIPRARLTSSPYSLALLGTTNLFPGAGTVGVGTISPAAGYQMHIANASGAGKLLVEGSTAASIDLKKGSMVGSIGFGSANDNLLVNPGANNTILQYNGSAKLTVTNNGASVAGTLDATTVNTGTLTATNFSPANIAITSKLAVGQASVDASNALKVTGSTWLNGSTYIGGFLEINAAAYNNYGAAYYTGNAPIAGYLPASNSFPYSLRCNNMISATNFVANSDRRIKKDFHLSENLADLTTLRKIRVTDYRHIDEVQNGTAIKKGFIAQEVEEVFPEAITTQTNFIPDVYALSTRTQLSGNNMRISLEKKHGLAVGDEVKLILSDSEKKVIVASVPTENTFVVAWDAAPADKIFVYGKQVKDFHTVDYDRIFTLNVSATQELARKVELLEKENAALKAENGQMKASAEKFDARLRVLESKLSN